MSSENRHFQRPLTVDEMERILSAISEQTTANDAFVEGFLTMWNIILGDAHGKTWDDFSTDNKIDPTMYAIPEGQWVKIADAMQRGLSPMDRTQLTLAFMNNGPSGYNPDKEPAKVASVAKVHNRGKAE